MRRKLTYIDSGRVRKVRLPAVIKKGDDLCIHKKTHKTRKHHKNHSEKNWHCHTCEAVAYEDINFSHIGSMWSADIYV